MSFTTYEQLQDQVRSWCARNDPNFATQVATFISSTEEDVKERLELEFQRVADTGVLPDTGEIVLPDGTLYIRRVSIDTQPPKHLAYVTPEELSRVRNANDGLPFRGYRENAVIRYAPVTHAGSPYSIDVVTAVPGLRLGGLTETNSYLDNVRDLLLNGSVMRGFRWCRNTEKALEWKGYYDEKMESLRRFHWRMRFSTGGPLRIQPDTYA